MNSRVNNEMLILAREARGLTQSELAAAISVTQGTLSKYESGLLNVSDEDLQKIATALDLPLTFFALPGEKQGFGTSCTYHRKRVTMPVKELNRILAQINMHRIRAEQLLRNVDIETENQFARLDIEEFGGDAARVAQTVRNYWKLSPGPILNLARAIENAGGIIFRARFGTRKLDAICQRSRNAAPFFFVNDEIPGDRVRWTLAHELGHLFMHQNWNADSDMEREADQFAAEFLMPARDISVDLNRVSLPDLARLKSYWKVSMQALILRAFDLGKITDRQKRSLYEQLSALGYRLNEPIAIPVEESVLFSGLFDTHFKELEYTIEDLGDLIGAYPHEIKSTYLQSQRKLRIV